jgi:leader peptidase (prepilin peptidase)/N-methyltransferase
VGIGLDVWGIVQGLPNHALLWGWLPRSILGAVVCAGVFVFIQFLGFALFRKEAMGDGDVKLARAIGSIMPLGQALVSFGLAITVGAVIGGGLVLYQTLKHGKQPEADEGEEVPVEGQEQGLPQILGIGALYMTFADIGFDIVNRFQGQKPEPAISENDDWQAGPTHIPFGPYMVIGFFLAIFTADRLIAAYLKWAGLG